MISSNVKPLEILTSPLTHPTERSPHIRRRSKIKIFKPTYDSDIKLTNQIQPLKLNIPTQIEEEKKLKKGRHLKIRQKTGEFSFTQRDNIVSIIGSFKNLDCEPKFN